MTPFKDLFSEGSAEYAEFRPSYPEALFDELARRCQRHELAWDCATGSGQAAGPLARRFTSVVASDPSAAQLANARRDASVHYLCSTAERPGLKPRIADCITVATAAHWIDRPAFYAHARAIATPNAVLALWCYGLARVTPEVDALIDDLYWHVLDGFWAIERRHVDDEYRSLEFPFEEFTVPRLTMRAGWTFEELVGYLGTWSATRALIKAKGSGVLSDWLGQFRAAWGAHGRRDVTWPLAIRAGYVR